MKKIKKSPYLPIKAEVFRLRCQLSVLEAVSAYTDLDNYTDGGEVTGEDSVFDSDNR